MAAFQEKAVKVKVFIEVETMAWLDLMYPLTGIETVYCRRESMDESKNIGGELTVIRQAKRHMRS